MSNASAWCRWFNLPDADPSVDHYVLLGLEPLEDQPDVIRAAHRERLHVLERHFGGADEELAQIALARLNEARDCLLNVKRKSQYDAQLLRKAGAKQSFQSPSELPETITYEGPQAIPQLQGGTNLASPGSSKLLVFLLVGAVSAVAVSVTLIAIGLTYFLWFERSPDTAQADAARADNAQAAGTAELPLQQSGSDPISLSSAKMPPPLPVVAAAEVVVAPAPGGSEARANFAPSPLPQSVETAANDEDSSAGSDSGSSSAATSISEPTGPAKTDPRPPTSDPVEVASVEPMDLLPDAAAEPSDDPTDDPTDDPAAQTKPIPAAPPIAPAAGTPPPLPQIEEELQREAYHAALKDMLNAGIGKVPNRDQAKEQFRKALAICTSDPRLYYGLALSLHTTQRDEAATLLRTALKEGAFDYPPAWILLIDMEVKKGVDDRLAKGLLHFARRLEQTSGPWPDEAAKVEFATYLGRVVGFCLGPAPINSKTRADYELLDAEIHTLLVGSRKAAYEAGRAEVLARLESRQNELREKSNEAAAELARQQEDAARKLNTDKQALADNEQKLVRRKEDFDAHWEKLKADFVRDWALLQNEHRIALQQAAALRQDILRINERIELYVSLATKAKGTADYTGKIESERIGRTQCEIQLRLVQQRGREIEARAAGRLFEITQAEAEYQRLTGQIVKESDFIAESRKSMNVEEKRSAKARPSNAKTPRGSTELKRFSTYYAIDLGAEKLRILDSYNAR